MTPSIYMVRDLSFITIFLLHTSTSHLTSWTWLNSWILPVCLPKNMGTGSVAAINRRANRTLITYFVNPGSENEFSYGTMIKIGPTLDRYSEEWVCTIMIIP